MNVVEIFIKSVKFIGPVTETISALETARKDGKVTTAEVLAALQTLIVKSTQIVLNVVPFSNARQRAVVLRVVEALPAFFRLAATLDAATDEGSPGGKTVTSGELTAAGGTALTELVEALAPKKTQP